MTEKVITGLKIFIAGASKTGKLYQPDYQTIY
jgi:hypothetical protein